MTWHSVTLTSGKQALVDFSKVLYVSAIEKGGATLHFGVVVPNSLGKPGTKMLNVREPVEAFSKALRSRKFL